MEGTILPASAVPTRPQVVDLAGTPYEMGLTHGQACRELIHEFAASVLQVHQANNRFLKAERDALTGFCLRNLGFLQK